MVVETDPESEQELPLEDVERVGEYFKSLFVRSLRLNLDDGFRERPWEKPPATVVDGAEGEESLRDVKDGRGGTD